MMSKMANRQTVDDHDEELLFKEKHCEGYQLFDHHR
jgi:hypothetical protein